MATSGKIFRTTFSGVPEGLDARVVADLTLAASRDGSPGFHVHVARDDRRLDQIEAGLQTVSLKRRVAGKFGHLDNGTAASLLAKIDCTKLKHVIAAHLSKSNNSPELARGALADALSCASDWIGIAEQDIGFAWREA